MNNNHDLDEHKQSDAIKWAVAFTLIAVLLLGFLACFVAMFRELDDTKSNNTVIEQPLDKPNDSNNNDTNTDSNDTSNNGSDNGSDSGNSNTDNSGGSGVTTLPDTGTDDDYPPSVSH